MAMTDELILRKLKRERFVLPEIAACLISIEKRK